MTSEKTYTEMSEALDALALVACRAAAAADLCSNDERAGRSKLDATTKELRAEIAALCAELGWVVS